MIIRPEGYAIWENIKKKWMIDLRNGSREHLYANVHTRKFTTKRKRSRGRICT